MKKRFWRSRKSGKKYYEGQSSTIRYHRTLRGRKKTVRYGWRDKAQDRVHNRLAEWAD